MPDYEIKIWNSSNLDVDANEWTRRAFAEASPVFLSEYFRWQVLEQFGGLYLDADCEILNGRILRRIVDEVYSQDEYEIMFGVEEKTNGHPTAQTMAAKPGAELVRFMKRMYEESLSGPLWHWREKRGLIGPQLMALYFLEKGRNKADDGFFKNLEKPVIRAKSKVYPQAYFSPKFTLLGDTIDYNADQTCVYHLFANFNINMSKNSRHQMARTRPLTFNEYRETLTKALAFPRSYDAAWLETTSGQRTENGIATTGIDGVLCYGPYISLGPGHYVATFHFDIGSIGGEITLTVTAEVGAVRLAHRVVHVTAGIDASHALPFTVGEGGVESAEFVVSSSGVATLSILRVDLDLKLPTPKPVQTPSLKTLHRIYFGFDGKPDPFVRYRQSWEEQLPEFKIIHWNATNLPMEINDYVRRLYAEKDHAFLTDYFRWYVLREYGGVYFDADVEVTNGRLFNRIVEELDDTDLYDAFIGIDEKSGGWYTAHSMASKPHSELATFMCEVYDNFGKFAAWRKKGLYFWAPQLVALYFANKHYNVAGMGTSPHLNAPIVVEHVKIYSQDWFSPISPSGRADKPFEISGLSDNTCLCHHFACSWHDDDSIYVKHAKTRGGQAGLLLEDILPFSGLRVLGGHSPLLFSEVGSHVGDKIATTHKEGYLVCGPGLRLPAGPYRIGVTLSDVSIWWGVRIELTDDDGKTSLLMRHVALSDIQDGRIVTDINLDTDCASFECRIFVDSMSRFSFSAMVIEQVAGLDHSFESVTRRFAGDSPHLLSIVGERNGSRIVTTHRAGQLIYGPYAAMSAGRYKIDFCFTDIQYWGRVLFDISADAGETKFLVGKIGLDELQDGRFTCNVSLDTNYERVECRLLVDAESQFAFNELSLQQITVEKPISADVSRAMSTTRRFAGDSPDLLSIVGERNGSRIVTTRRAGQLIYGPYAAMSAGRYKIDFCFTDIQYWGRVLFDISADAGETKFLVGKIGLDELQDGRFTCNVSLDTDYERVECRLLVDAESQFAFNELSLQQIAVDKPISADKSRAVSMIRRFAGDSPHLLSIVGEINGSRMVTTRRPGQLIYGPYIAMSAGRYKIDLSFTDIQYWGTVLFDVTADAGETKFLVGQIGLDELQDGRFTCHVSLDMDCKRFECRLLVDAESQFAFNELSIEQISSR